MIPPFVKVRTKDEDLRQVQDGVVKTLGVISRKEILDGRLLKGVILLMAGTTLVAHGLGREALGWIVVENIANAVVWQEQSDVPSKLLALNCSADTTVSLWVF